MIKNMAHVGRFQRLGLLMFLIGLVGFFSIMSRHFLSWENFTNILVQSAVLIIAGAGMTIVIATAGIDLSVDSILALSGIVMAGAIAAHTITAHNLIPRFVKAAQKGIVTVTDWRVDMKAAREAGANPIPLGLVDYYAQGEIGAEYIAKALAKKRGGKVAIIEGMPAAPQSQGRRRGAEDGFSAEPSVKLVSVQPGDWDRKKAYDITTNLLQAHPDLKGIMCANDVMALAATEAIEAAGKTGQVLVSGIDLIPQAKEAISQGRLVCSVAFSPYVIGQLVTRTAISARMGKEIPKDLKVISVLATKDNIGDLADWR